MKNILFQGLVIVAGFFATWSLLTNVDWMTLFRVEHLSQTTEEKIGDLIWDLLSKAEPEIVNDDVAQTLDSILVRVCEPNNIDKSQIKLHLIQSDEVNAFALPDKHIVFYSGLILEADNAAQLSGVLCHELAHIQLSHVMKKLVKEVGLTVLISMTAGVNNPGVIAEAAKLLSSTAFDRELEREADMMAVEYMIKADINPGAYADFLFKLADNETLFSSHLSWVSTHPETIERAENILTFARDSDDNQPVLSEAGWENVRAELENVQ